MLLQPNCSKRKCKHYLGIIQPDGTEMTECVACEAFPEGIPDEIAYGDNDHTSPFTGDNGIQFEKAKSFEDTAMFRRMQEQDAQAEA